MTERLVMKMKVPPIARREMMRYRLQTLLMVLAVGPPLLWALCYTLNATLHFLVSLTNIGPPPGS